DQDLAAVLKEDLSARPEVEIVEADILDLDLGAVLERLGARPALRARVIANLPYAIATAIILRLIERRPRLSALLVLVPREVADRIGSPAGRKSYGGLSVLCQAHARVETILRLKPGSFRPIPRVESELVRLTFPRPEAALAAPERAGGRGPDLESLLRAAF